MESLGLCIKCATTQMCFDSNLGSICRECWTKMAFDPRQATEEWHGRERIIVPPKPGQKVYVLVEGAGTYITVHGVLYGFERKKDVETFIGRLRESDPLEGVRIEYEDAEAPLSYSLRHPPLRMISIKKLGKET